MQLIASGVPPKTCAALLFVAWGAGCQVDAASEPNSPRTQADGPEPSALVSPREPVVGLSRPAQLASSPFAYDDLPVAPAPMSIEPPMELEISADDDRLRGADGAIARVVARQRAFYSPAKARPDKDVPCPFREGARGVFEALSTEGWTRDALRFRSGEAQIEGCRVRVSAVEEVVAKAIIPDLLYAFRRRVGEMKPAREDLVLVGPPSSWVVTSAPGETQTQWRAGAFTIAPVPLAEGSSASALLDVDWNELRFFMSPHARARVETVGDVRVYGQRLELAADLIWREGARPEGLARVASITPEGARVLEEIWR